MAKSQRLTVLRTVPPEVVVHDQPGDCAYLPERTWRLPLRLPLRQLNGDELDGRLAEGDRREGRLLYRTHCPDCDACEPIRIDVERFEPGKTQRRTWRQGSARIRVTQGPVMFDAQRAALFKKHKRERRLDAHEPEASLEELRSFLVDSCCDSMELRYHLDGQLLGIAIVDRGTRAMSAVYTYYDPAHARLSPGTFSILYQIHLCGELGLRYLYLGLHVPDCRSMRYKASFLPHERRIDGRWLRFDRDSTELLPPKARWT